MILDLHRWKSKTIEEQDYRNERMYLRYKIQERYRKRGEIIVQTMDYEEETWEREKKRDNLGRSLGRDISGILKELQCKR